MRTHVTNRTWSDADNERFKALRAEGVSPHRMSVIFKRTTAAVKQKARQLGMPFPRKQQFSINRSKNEAQGDGFYRP
ncbi:hypothetical protein [Afipia clevelandensis]|uniref:GcrA cell cycle regulator n=1 Tax=Afipia clevelandensis ATCC 49720 TaxID=883079 RepID=K8PNI6_9BRAD|nr:hypothetical protein [Afipia clevelandensis]EKS39923.1 hypothetical protein HMPREF9696_00935 [Afipia clevelandensis ATCC 49720]